MDYKKDFSVFSSRKEMVYLDSAASSLKPDVVTNAIVDYYHNYSANIERGMYKTSFEATKIVEETRSKIATFFGAKNSEVIFTRGATDSLNMVAISLRNTLKDGDEILTTQLEHHSSFLPWLNVSKEKKIKINFVPLTKEGEITIDSFKKALTSKTKIVAISHVSNVLGYVNPIKEITKLAHEVGAIVSVDGAQAIPHFKVDVKELDADFYSFSFHKICGPTGLGVLYGKKELLNKMEPAEFGGEMNDEVTTSSVTYKEAPYKFEAGTIPIAEVFGANKAIDYINNVTYESIQEREDYLTKIVRAELSKIKEIKIYNNLYNSPIISFNLMGVHSHDAANYYTENDICIRAGLHCAEPLHKFLNISASLRASIYFYNDEKDIEKFIEVTKEAISFFKEVGYLG